jgi:hypothetical protein
VGNDKLKGPKKEFIEMSYSLVSIIYKTEAELCGIKRRDKRSPAAQDRGKLFCSSSFYLDERIKVYP